MEFHQLITSRLETRNFADNQDIPSANVRKIVEAGRMAPSAMNRQPWKFAIVKDQKKLNALGQQNPNARYIEKAGFAVGIYIQNSRFGEIDATRAITNMQLVASSLEPPIGSCFNFGWDEKQAAEVMGSFEGFKLFTIIPFGYPRKINISAKKKRKAWTEVVVEI